jgi:hypothetical protein
MAAKKRIGRKKAVHKSSKRGKLVRPVKSRKDRKNPEARKPNSLVQVIQAPARIVIPPVERPRVTIGTIRGDTVIGDLLVAFPRTRDVLVRTGMRLDADDAGDIYMTLDAFSAMNDLKTEKLVMEIVLVAKEPSSQPVAAPLVATPTV